jgi:multifunctional methyltransferase subunit TRM112
MKLLTHNMLASHVKGVTDNYPLKIEVEKVRRSASNFFVRLSARRPTRAHPPSSSSRCSQVEIVDADFDAAFLRHILPRLDWPALVSGAAALGAEPPLPADPPTPAQMEDDGFLRALHHVLLEVCLSEGALVCPGSGRRFPVVKGVPNMLLSDGQ